MELISKLAEQGVISLLLAISLIGNIYLFRIILSEKEKRITEAQTVRDKILQPLDQLQKTIDGITIILQSVVKNKI